MLAQWSLAPDENFEEPRVEFLIFQVPWGILLSNISIQVSETVYEDAITAQLLIELFF